MTAVKKAPKGDRYYDKVAIRYEKKRKKQEWWHVEQREMQDLLDLLPRNLSVVDIPFGTGRFVPYYLERGYAVHGLDVSQDMLTAANAALGDEAYGRCTCVTGDAAKLPYQDGQFDLLVSTRFLRDIVFFPDAQKMLAEFARVTKKYAIIQLGENAEGHMRPADDEVMGSKMSRNAVRALLKKNGLSIKERRHVHFVEGEGDIYHLLCEKD